MPTIDEYSTYISDNGGCRTSRDWMSQFETAEAAWAACDRPSWLVWSAAVAAKDGWDLRRLLVACAHCIGAVHDQHSVNDPSVKSRLADHRRRLVRWALGQAPAPNLLYMYDEYVMAPFDYGHKLFSRAYVLNVGGYPSVSDRRDWQGILSQVPCGVSYEFVCDLFRQFYPAPPAI